MRSGSSVIEVHTRVAGANAIPNPGQVFEKVKGQAVAVDLPNHQTLFALLRSDDSLDWSAHVLPNCTKPIPPAEALKLADPFVERMRRTYALTGSHDVPRWLPHLPGPTTSRPPSGWPMMVRFKNLHDPKSVERVNPDNLTTSFGPGYAVRRVTVEPTDEPVSTGIRTRLEWLSSYQGRMLDGARINNSTALSNNLTVADFDREAPL